VDAADARIAVLNEMRVTVEKGKRAVLNGAEFFSESRIKICSHRSSNANVQI
jgi:hypothetical protein